MKVKMVVQGSEAAVEKFLKDSNISYNDFDWNMNGDEHSIEGHHPDPEVIEAPSDVEVISMTAIRIIEFELHPHRIGASDIEGAEPILGGCTNCKYYGIGCGDMPCEKGEIVTVEGRKYTLKENITWV